MADNHSKEIRSMNMSHIRSKDNKPEEIVRKFFNWYLIYSLVNSRCH